PAPFPFCAAYRVSVRRPVLDSLTRRDCTAPPKASRVVRVMVFVTGRTGFIGGALVRQLRARGDDVVALVRNPSKGAALEDLGCTLVAGHLNDERAIRAGIEGSDAVIHAAAVYEVGIPVSE